MRWPKSVLAVLVPAILLLSIGAVVLAVAPPGIIDCYMVPWSDLEEIDPGLFVDPTMPERQREMLLSRITASKVRVASLYGEYSAYPVIIAGHTMEVMKKYGGNSYNRIGRTYLTPVKSFIILGPDGIYSEDVVAHELAHAEFSQRVGHWQRKNVPNWFDEGLALQFDDRYSDAEWRLKTANGQTAPVLNKIGIIKHNDWLAYATAKHEVGQWLAVEGNEGFREFLDAVEKGANFEEIFITKNKVR